MKRSNSLFCGLAVAAVVGLAGAAHANILASLTSGPTVDGSNFDYNYAINVSADERLDPTATASNNPAGTFFTVYDVQGFISASTSASGWSESATFLGVTPTTQNPPDSPTLMNVTFTYTGAVVAGYINIPGFQIISSFDGLYDGFSSAQATKNAGDQNGQSDWNTNPLTVPGSSVPEPASLGILGVGSALLLLRRKSR